ncbi:MAG: DUF2309 domain-containing protein [Pseudomonadota bacterium]
MKPGHSTETDVLEHALQTARHILPDQGPIGVFIHHNTLHSFQHLRFHDAVQEAASLTGARPYLDLHEFRAAFHAGRIEEADLAAAIRSHLGESGDEAILATLSRFQLWHHLMLEETAMTNTVELDWQFRSASPAERKLIQAAHKRADDLPAAPYEKPHYNRHAEVLRVLNAADSDVVVHDELIRWCAAFLDQGQALTPMPGRDLGFLQAVARMYAKGAGSPRGCPGVAEDFQSIARNHTPPHTVIRECLHDLGIEEQQLTSFISATAAALNGWAGMFARLEHHEAENHAHTPATLAEFMAVRLVLERRALGHICSQARLPLQWPALLAQVPDMSVCQRSGNALILYKIAQGAGLDAAGLEAIDETQLNTLWQAVATCTPLKRRELWMDAYESWYYRQILNGIAALRPKRLIPDTQQRPAAQYMFCMDEREESIRRAVEEHGPDYQTFGLAGFFGVAIDYQGLYDHKPAAYCPVVVTPAHEVHETPLYTHRDWHELRNSLRNVWRYARRRTHFESRTLSGGAGLSLLLGPVYAVMAAIRILLPRGSVTTHERVTERVSPKPATRLLAVRDTNSTIRTERGKLLGFTLEEATERVTNVLRSIGLVENFAPIVIALGHGSTSLNNPHESAHDCGACGGRRGGANARLFAGLANEPEVRIALRSKGITIPADTWFIGGLHDTADDNISYSDLADLPHALVDAFEQADHVLDLSRRMSAAERCRRFHNASLPITPDAGLHHVETRARQLAQPRPEYGHCTNAVAVVGRRSLTRGLHLDRRAFLISYDPTIDPEHQLLERILAAAGPVGAGISLEYYFSAVDNERYGCGTKLPHNVIGLLGIMNGHKSDLRTGLPLQMVELHEPMRLLIIAESTPEALLGIAGRQAEVRELVVNRWVQLACVDPDTGAMYMFTDKGFVPYVPDKLDIPLFDNSAARHGLHRQHLTPALVAAALRRSAPHAEQTVHSMEHRPRYA